MALCCATYQKSALEVNFDIIQPGDVHDRVDIVSRGLENDLPTSTACLESIKDGGRVVGGIGSAGLDGACFFSSSINLLR